MSVLGTKEAAVESALDTEEPMGAYLASEVGRGGQGLRLRRKSR